MLTDTIADMLTRIRNANKAGHDVVKIPASKLKASIAEILEKENFLDKVETEAEGIKKYLKLHIKYGPKKQRIILGLKRISRPGRKMYVAKGEIPQVRGGLGISILSTSKGILTDKEAKQVGVGGELLCQVW